MTRTHFSSRLGPVITIGCVWALCGAGLAAAQTPTPAPAPTTAAQSPAVQPAAAQPLADMLPDNEFVNGYALGDFDTAKTVAAAGGYLARYNEIVDGRPMSGAAIVQQVADDYSVSPRLLLALIETYSRWVTDPNPVERTFPVGEPLPGLNAGLSVAADSLNRLYYGRKLQGQASFPVAGGQSVALPGVNAATFGLVGYLSRATTVAEWAGLELPSRFSMAWTGLFGDPFAGVAVGGILTPPVTTLRLPFPPGEVWYYVVGPHSGWGVGGPRSAVDFSPPPSTATGCFPSVAWVTAAADGVVTDAGGSALVVDVDEKGDRADGFAGTGWAHVYAHLNVVDRAAPGTRVKAGDHLGHPSCETTPVPLTRVAFSRRFNGEWIPADNVTAPLTMDGWTALAGPEPGTGWLAHAGLAPRAAGATKQDQTNGVTALPSAP